MPDVRSLTFLVSLINGFGCLLGDQPNPGHFHSAGNTALDAVIVDLTGRNAPFRTCFFECYVVHIYTSNIAYYISFARKIQGEKYEL